MISGDKLYSDIIEDLKEEFPDFEIKKKSDSLFMKILNVLVIIFTFGAQKEFMKSYVSVISNKVYTPSKWDGWTIFNKTSILRHERVHMRQVKKYTGFIYNILYLFIPLPMVLAYFRMKFEREAYEETIRFAFFLGGETYVTDKKFKEHIVSQFVSGKYGWMWPFRAKMEGWFDDYVKELVRKNKDTYRNDDIFARAISERLQK